MESVRFIPAMRLMRVLILCMGFILVACGGSSKTASISPSSSAVSVSSSSAGSINVSSASASSISSASSALLTISGTATYDFVPYHADHIGLDYAATKTLPIRGAVVELVDEVGAVVAQTYTDNHGFYSFETPRQTAVQVRVKAHLLHTLSPTWDVSVTDNTNNNALYILTGSLTDSGNSDSRRNLHASSGWGSIDYTSTRAAAPFAILDAVYGGLQRLVDAGNSRNLPPVEFRWSSNNVTAANPNNDYSSGEIGTSFFDRGAIYLLGEADIDTDEYDSHVVLHEWTHYLENALARLDNPGGSHGYADRLDIRVAHSEGFANAFAAMILDDKHYRDSGGVQQAGGYAYDISEAHHSHAGWYNEASVESILYNYYLSSSNKNARDLSYIVNAFNAEEYRQTAGAITIHLFVGQLQSLFPAHTNLLEDLLNEQLIFGRGIYSDGETNAANYDPVLPIYKVIEPNAAPVNICSTSRFGEYNKLGVAQFLRLDIATPATYQITVTKNGGDVVAADPDLIIFERGVEIIRADSSQVNLESVSRPLAAGQYLLEVFDWHNRRENVAPRTTCFDVQVF